MTTPVSPAFPAGQRSGCTGCARGCGIALLVLLGAALLVGQAKTLGKDRPIAVDQGDRHARDNASVKLVGDQLAHLWRLFLREHRASALELVHDPLVTTIGVDHIGQVALLLSIDAHAVKVLRHLGGGEQGRQLVIAANCFLDLLKHSVSARAAD